MSWPAMRGMLNKGRLKQAADDLEATLHKTRIRAVQSGTMLVLRYSPGGRMYRVEPWEAIAPDETRARPDGDDAAVGSAVDDEALRIAPLTKELPEGVRFATVDPLESARRPGPAVDVEAVTAAESTAHVSTPGDPQWSESIEFYANGRSANAELRLVNERRFFIDVMLRGLTGQVRTTAPARLPPTEPSLSADESLRADDGDTAIPQSE
jgi:hypothetical protein